MAHLLGHEPGSIANRAQAAAWAWRELPVPVFCAVHGATFGGGLQIALGADVRFAGRDTRMSVMELRYGLIPDMALTQTLLRLVRADVAAELVYTARVVDVEEAARLGLVTAVCDDPFVAAMAAAQAAAGMSPHAVRAAKRLLRDAPSMDAAAALGLEEALQIPLLGSANQIEAVMATMQKRAASFHDP
jgi:enoyl-CoA hydratase/carnithine racemase